MSIDESINKIAGELSLFDEPLQKYEYIIELGHDLQSLDNKYKNDIYKVKGCMSTVWLHPYKKDKKLYFEADADAVIVKGLVQILITIYSGHLANEILKSDISILHTLGLDEIITAGRQNGVASMLKQIYSFARENTDD